MRKKILSMILVCVLCVSIFACGASETTSTPKGSTTKEEPGEQTVDANKEEKGSGASEIEMNRSEEAPESETTSEVNEKNNVGDFESNYEITRDVYGLITEKRYKSQFNYSDFEIDAKGNITSAKVTGDNTHVMLYEYDDNNRLIKSTKQTMLYGTEEQNWSYNEDGNLTELRMVETDKNGASKEKIDKYNYDESGNYIGGTRTTNGGDVFDVNAECDEMGRVTKVTEVDNGEIKYTYTYTYEEGVFNPVHRTEESTRSKYEIDVAYDDQGRIVHEDAKNKDGEKSANDFVYDVISTITESPETNQALIPGNEWIFFEDCPLLPEPSSCLKSILPDETNNKMYLLPTFKGSFISASGQPHFVPYVLESQLAFTALDQYTNILTDVLGMEVKRMGSLFKISKDGSDIASFSLEIINGNYCLIFNPS